ncbi:MAG: hypothetical protein QXS38_01225 [Candidatus Pacearchaeota archaeon]
MTLEDKFLCKTHEANSYRGRTLVKTVVNGRTFNPEELYKILSNYEDLLINGKYEEAESIEKENGYPVGWLNIVISNLINVLRNNDGLAERLVERFSNRGYDKLWLKTKTIKSAEAKI